MMQQNGSMPLSSPSQMDELIDLQRRRLILERGKMLSDVFSTLNALAIAERATHSAIDVEQTVTAAATVTLLNEVIVRGNVGIFQPLIIIPNVSNVFNMTVTVDATPYFQDASVVQFPIIPTGLWKPVYQSFVVSVTNNDAANDIIHLIGDFWTLQEADWRAIHDQLRLAYWLAIHPTDRLPQSLEQLAW